MFSLSEDFNKRIMSELSEEQEVALHKEAWDLFNLYLKSSSIHKVQVSKHLVQDIFQSMPRLD